MHERTQRALARLMFVLCCALPTSITFATIVVTWTPWYHERCLSAIEIQLSQETGLLVTIADFERASPNLLRLRGIELRDPETKREVARVRLATWATLGERAALQLSQPTLQSEQLDAFWRAIHDRFLCRPDRTDGALRLVADDLTVDSRTGPMTFRDVDLWLRPLARAVQVDIQCVPAASRDNTPVSMMVRRDRTGDHPTTEWTLETGQTALPCSAIADFSPLLERLGRDASFSGKVRWQWTEGAWLLDLQGSRFTNVDLSRLFETLPHRLTGTAELSFDRGYVDPGKRIDVIGSLRARDGYIGDSLVRAAHQHLRFGVADGATAGQTLPYDRLGVRFNLMGAQLQLSGICAGEPGYESLPPGIALCADGRAVAWTGTEPPILPSVQLAYAIAPDHSVPVPLAQQTAPIMDLLLPPSRQLPAGAAPTGPRITRSETWSGAPLIVQPSAEDRGADAAEPENERSTFDETPWSMNR